VTDGQQGKSTAEDGNSERRQHFRGSARPGRRIEIRFRPKGSADDHALAITRNIGVGGAFIVTDMRPEPGSRLELVIAMPGTEAETLQVDGEVRWVAEGAEGTKGGIGVRFHALDVSSLLALSGYFATLAAPVEGDPEPGAE